MDPNCYFLIRRADEIDLARLVENVETLIIMLRVGRSTGKVLIWLGVSAMGVLAAVYLLREYFVGLLPGR
jgi:hypothetical protein